MQFILGGYLLRATLSDAVEKIFGIILSLLIMSTSAQAFLCNGSNETAALQAALDNGGEVDLACTVTVTNVYFRNSTLSLISSSSQGKISGTSIIVQHTFTLDGVDLNVTNISFPASGGISNCIMANSIGGKNGAPTLINFQSDVDTDYSGCVFDNLTDYRFYGKASGIAISNVITTVLDEGAEHAGAGWLKLSGSNNTIEYNSIDCTGQPACLKFLPGLTAWKKSSENNIIRYNDLEGANEEALGWDALGETLQTGHVATVPSSNQITVTKDYGMPLVGANAVGHTIYFFSGNAKGQYFKITAQSYGTLTLSSDHGATAVAIS